MRPPQYTPETSSTSAPLPTTVAAKSAPPPPPAAVVLDARDESSERAITSGIRRAIMADQALSLGAKKVEIITVGRKVTLRGRVSGDREKATLVLYAKHQGGVTAVEDQLEAN